MSAAVVLVNPKYPRNVGNALRACSNFGAGYLAWTPERVEDPRDWPQGERLPREERMRLYRDVTVVTHSRSLIVGRFTAMGMVPVAVEVRDSSEQLPRFRHPENAVYVFGPEDGALDRAILKTCYRFVVIPATNCLNLSAAVNVVLYDRMAKLREQLPTPRNTNVYARAEG